MKKVLILNGSARKNGNTTDLVNAFAEGAESAGHEVTQVFLRSLHIDGCLGCLSCRHKAPKATPCIQHDDMDQVYDAFKAADVVVFASPIYFDGITGTLKNAIDRLFAVWITTPRHQLMKDCALISTSAAMNFESVDCWYSQFPLYNGWNDLGRIYGRGVAFGDGKATDPESIEAARSLGASIA